MHIKPWIQNELKKVCETLRTTNVLDIKSLVVSIIVVLMLLQIALVSYDFYGLHPNIDSLKEEVFI